MPPKLNVGIIGAGRIGKVHSETLAFRVPEARALAITDLNPEAAERVALRCGIPKVAGSMDEILTDPSIQAVLI
jgi:myo-inositol 2-dehydrogenase / D-chiro-inositol 1-dehydrogenase